MGFMDFLKAFATEMASQNDRSVRNIERKYGDRMSSEQREKAERFHDFASGVKEWAKPKKQQGK